MKELDWIGSSKRDQNAQGGYGLSGKKIKMGTRRIPNTIWQPKERR